MGKESLEEGLLPSSSILEANHTGDGSDITEQSDSSATPIVVFSTFISVCGFLVLGCSVSSLLCFMVPVELHI